MDPDLRRKYKGIVVGALNGIEALNDKTSVLVSSEATKIENVDSRVKIDDDALIALKALRKRMGEYIRVIMDAQAEYDRLDAEEDDLDSEVV